MVDILVDIPVSADGQYLDSSFQFYSELQPNKKKITYVFIL